MKNAALGLALAALFVLPSYGANGDPQPPSHGCSWEGPEFHATEIRDSGNPPSECRNWWEGPVDGTMQTSSGYCTEVGRGPSGAVLWQVNMVIGDTGADITGIASCQGVRFSYQVTHCPKALNGMEPSAAGNYSGAGCNWLGADHVVHTNFCKCDGPSLVCASS